MKFISPDRLLTIGINTPIGTRGRAMVSLFDVNDLTSPRLIDQYNLPKYSSSLASNDHHAFGWFANHELLSVPVAMQFAERFDHIYSVGADGIRVVNVNGANTVVDEVLFDWAIDSDDDSLVTFNYSSLATAARELLADRGVNRGDLFFVTQERHAGEVELVFRDDDNHYRLRGTSDKNLEVIDESFEFLANAKHSTYNPFDANNDGKVTALDALKVINGDGRITANDALRIINELARQRSQALSSADKISVRVDEPVRRDVDDETRLF